MTTKPTLGNVPLSDQLGGWIPPQGWTVDTPDWLPGCVALGKPGLGWVTVDMKSRIFSAGIGSPRKWGNSDSGHTFSGGNWRKRIMDAAEQYLRACN